MKRSGDIYGIVGEFESEQALRKAAERGRERGYKELDAFSALPLEGMNEILGRKGSWAPAWVFTGGVLGGLTGYLMQWWGIGSNFPFNIGGRPLNSWPMYVPITFELTILCSSLLGFVGTLALCRFPEPYHPVFNVPEFSRASRDRFFLCIETSDPKFDASATLRFLEGLDPYYLEWVEQ